MAEKESDMEKRLLACLTTGESQWTYRPDIRDEAALWQNFRQKLNQNNLAVLDGQLLTDEEFSQIRDFMLDQVFFVKLFSPFSSFHIPIVIMGNSSLSAGLVRIQIPQLRPAA